MKFMKRGIIELDDGSISYTNDLNLGIFSYHKSDHFSFTSYDVRLYVPWFPRKKQIAFYYWTLKEDRSFDRGFGKFAFIRFSYDWLGKYGFSKKRKLRLFDRA